MSVKRLLAVALVGLPLVAADLNYSVFASAALGRLLRFGDNPIGSGPNFGAGAGLRHSSGLAVEFEYNRTLGLEPSPVPCAILNVTCVGSARNGVLSAEVVSANVLYYFGRSRVQPFVSGGVGALRSKNVSSIVWASETRAIFEEQEWSDTGLAVSFGGGLKVRLGSGFWIRPELRFYGGSIRSRANLSLFRPAVAAGYEW
jgi:opacity protein-like surface antigen